MVSTRGAPGQRTHVGARELRQHRLGKHRALLAALNGENSRAKHRMSVNIARLSSTMIQVAYSCFEAAGHTSLRETVRHSVFQGMSDRTG
jgi:hypothetical protein